MEYTYSLHRDGAYKLNRKEKHLSVLFILFIDSRFQNKSKSNFMLNIFVFVTNTNYRSLIKVQRFMVNNCVIQDLTWKIYS